MEKPKTYCQAVKYMEEGSVHKVYHDTQYGFPITDDNELFGRLIRNQSSRIVLDYHS